MTKRELMKDPALQNESWDRFLPQFKKKNVQTKKPKKQVVKKKYTPFPPPQQPSKIDLQLESGEYFMKEHEKKQKKHDEKEQAQQQKTAQKRKEKEAVFVAPKEENLLDTESQETNSDSVDIEALKKKLKNKNLKFSSSVPIIPQEEIVNIPPNSTESNEVPKKKKKKTKCKDESGISSQDSNASSVKTKRKKKKDLSSDVISEPTGEETSVKSDVKKRKKSKIADSENVTTDLDVAARKKKKKLKMETS